MTELLRIIGYAIRSWFAGLFARNPWAGLWQLGIEQEP